METPFKIELQQERSFSEKMNGMFTYLSQNFKTIVRALFFIVGPVALLAGICNGLFQMNLTKFTATDFMQQNAEIQPNTPMAFLQIWKNIFTPTYFLLILFSLSGVILVKIIVYAHMKIYAASPTKEVAFEEIFEEVKANFVKVFFSVIGISFFLLIGFVFFILPGIYLTIVFAMFLPVMVIERVGFFESINRSFFLISNKWWSTFGLLFITGIIVEMGAFVFYLPMYVFQIMRLLKVTTDGSVNIFEIISAVFSTVGVMFVYSLFSFATGMQYFNLVERREGKGLRSAIDSIGLSTPAQNNTDQDDL